MNEAKQILGEVHALLASRGFAATFLTVDDYRAVMLDFINESKHSQGQKMNNLPLIKLLDSLHVRQVALCDSEDPEQNKLSIHYSAFGSELRTAMASMGMVVPAAAAALDGDSPTAAAWASAFTTAEMAFADDQVGLFALDYTKALATYLSRAESILGAEKAPSTETGSLHLDAAGVPKLAPTLLEQVAIDTINQIKAWADGDRKGELPQDALMNMDAALMLYESRRHGQPQVGGVA